MDWKDEQPFSKPLTLQEWQLRETKAILEAMSKEISYKEKIMSSVAIRYLKMVCVIFILTKTLFLYMI